MPLAPALALVAVLLAQMPWIVCYCDQAATPTAAIAPLPEDAAENLRGAGHCHHHGHAGHHHHPSPVGEPSEPEAPHSGNHEIVTIHTVVGTPVGLDAPAPTLSFLITTPAAPARPDLAPEVAEDGAPPPAGPLGCADSVCLLL